MGLNRRHVLKQLGFGITSIGIAPLISFNSPELFSLPAYPTDNIPVRLSANENPYGPSPLARAAMAESIVNSNRYTWNTSRELIAAIAQKNNVTGENILIGAGSSEILDLVARFCALQKGSAIVATPSFTGWTKTAESIGLKKISIPLTANKQHDLPAMLSAIQSDTKLMYVCNPNNPTGTICSRDALISFIREATKKTTVLIDEAYIDFTEQLSLGPLVTQFKNLIVVKTFSKIYGLAGGRIGYALANADTINSISQLQTWTNGSVSVTSRAGAIASLKDEEFVKQSYARNQEIKKFTIEQLTKLGIPCIPSHTNFIYFSLAGYKNDYFDLLKRNNIQGTFLYEEEGKWTRITVGTEQEMRIFVNALQ